MTLTEALWRPFPRAYWPQCPCGEVCETHGFRRLRCRACGQLAERALPAKLQVGEEACAAIERAERLIAQLAVMGFRAQLDDHGALGFADTTPERRDFARMCRTAHCFVVVAALDVDLGFVAGAVSRPSKKQRIARAGRDRFVADGWAEKALAHGWSKRELFALPARWSRVNQCGVAGLVGERRVISATADAIAIETESGARLRFYRRAPMMLGTSYLIGRTLAENIPQPGQADWARPDAAETCRACLFWSGAKRDRWGALKPAIWRQARQLLPGRRLSPVPHYAHSCRFFEANPSPPEAMK